MEKPLLVLNKMLREKMNGLQKIKSSDLHRQVEQIEEIIALLDLARKWGFEISLEEAQNLMGPDTGRMCWRASKSVGGRMGRPRPSLSQSHHPGREVGVSMWESNTEVIAMDVVKATVKGQVLIPASLRRKYQIERGTALRVYGGKNRIILEPVVRDPVEKGRGMLKTKGRILKSLIEDRKREAKQ